MITWISLMSMGLAFGFSAGIAPGPVSAITLSRSLQHGFYQGIKFIGVVLITDLVIACFLLRFLSTFHDLSLFLTIISFLGAAFLAWLGVQNLKNGAPSKPEIRPGASTLRDGMAVALLNPNVYLFWGTIAFPLFIKHNLPLNVLTNSFIHGFYFSMFFVLGAIAMGASLCFQWFSGTGYRVFIKAMGVMLLLFSALLVNIGMQHLHSLAG